MTHQPCGNVLTFSAEVQLISGFHRLRTITIDKTAESRTFSRTVQKFSRDSRRLKRVPEIRSDSGQFEKFQRNQRNSRKWSKVDMCKVTEGIGQEFSGSFHLPSRQEYVFEKTYPTRLFRSVWPWLGSNLISARDRSCTSHCRAPAP